MDVDGSDAPVQKRSTLASGCGLPQPIAEGPEVGGAQVRVGVAEPVVELREAARYARQYVSRSTGCGRQYLER